MGDHFLNMARIAAATVSVVEAPGAIAAALAEVQAFATLAVAEALTTIAARPHAALSEVAEFELDDAEAAQALPSFTDEVASAIVARTVTVWLDTGRWVTSTGGGLTGAEGALVASSVLPGTTPELVHAWYSGWLSNDPVPRDLANPVDDRARGYL